MMRMILASLIALGTWTLAVPGSGAPTFFSQRLFSQAWADQKDKRLPDLFKRLKTAPSSSDAALIESDIWKIWFETNNAELDALMDRGSTAMEAQDFPAALDAFNQIIKTRPDFSEGWNRRATLYYLMGDYKKSLADIDRTLKLEPKHFGAISGQGLVNMQLDHLEAAEESYKHVLAISPKNVGAQRNLDTVRELIKKKSI